MFNASKATGSDGIPAKVLKRAASEICQSVTNIFNASFQHGLYPSMWKIARVTPLFKSGTKSEHDNFRPISILPCISKIQERFANPSLQQFATDTGIIENH